MLKEEIPFRYVTQFTYKRKKNNLSLMGQI